MRDRFIVLDTETTGKRVDQGHRLIEVGCVEILDRKCTGDSLYRRVNPCRSIDPGAIAVHGIRDADVLNQPVFGEVADELIAYIKGATLIIHNAAFDIAFLNSELSIAGRPVRIEEMCDVIDTLKIARKLHPGQGNSLDALCRRYGVDAASRGSGHGALVDAQLLANVYLLMTAGQSAITFSGESRQKPRGSSFAERLGVDPTHRLSVIRANDDEVAAHELRLGSVHKAHIKALESEMLTVRNELRATRERIDLLRAANLYSDPDGEIRAHERIAEQKQSRILEIEALLVFVRKRGPITF